MSLALWFENGATAVFQDVKDFKEGLDTISFNYHGVSTDVRRNAKFQKNKIAGFALSE